MRRFSNTLAVLVLVTLLLLSNTTASYAKAPIDTEDSEQAAPMQWVPGRVLVKFKPNQGFTSASASFMWRFGAQRVGRLNRLNVEILEVPVGQEMAIANALSADSSVLYAEPDYLVYAAYVPNDTDYADQWSHPLINSEDAWDISTGSGVVIGIIDSGIDPNHPDLQANIVAGYDFVDDDNDPTDLNGHGTHVAGIAAAVTNNTTGVAGVAGGAKIMPLRVLNAEGSGSILDIADAITYAAANGVDVVNLSVGSTFNAMVLQDAVNVAYAADMVVVAAAGNSTGTTQSYPAAHAHVIAVSATGPGDTITSYSNYGQYVDVAAPGGEMTALHDPDGVYSTVPTYDCELTTVDGINNNYDYLQGTSMAAPHVTGLVALLRSADSTLTADEVELIIEKSAEDLGDPGFDMYYGHGRIDTTAALELSNTFTVTSTVFYADDDAYIDDDTTVNWSSAVLWVGAYNRDLYRSLIKFDLSTIPVTATIESAELMLSLYGTIGDSQRFVDARRITADWSEGNLAKNVNYGSDIYDTVALSDTFASWYNWNITGLVEEWVGGTYANYGVTIMDKTNASKRPNNFFGFDSRQTGTPAYQPYLSVTYSVDLPCYDLTLSATNGSITPDVAPNCGTDQYYAGTEVELSASPAAHYSFSGWSGDLSGATNPETITVDEDKAVTASFAPICFTLSTNSDPVAGGGVTPSAGTCPGDSSKYLEGSVVSLSAAPATGYSFTSWSGDASGSANPGSVTMSANKSVTANFTALACYDLSLSATNGSITPDVAPNCGTDQYYAGTEVELSASPAAHYSFSGWSGDLSGATNPETITVDEDKAVTASFAPICFTLSTDSDPVAGGSVTPSAGTCPGDSSKYLEGSVVTLSASPATGYSFTSWSGDASGSANPGSVTMSANKSVTANFTALACYDLTLSATNGSITPDVAPNCGSDQYYAGTEVELSASPAAHYSFSGWSGDLSGATNPETITVDEDKAVTASFAPICFTLSTDSDPVAGGSVTPSAGTCPGDSSKYLEGSVVTLSASPATGYSFTSWSGDASGSANPGSVTMSANKSVTANFTALACYDLTLSATNGSITPDVAPNCGSDQYYAGTEVELSASPAAHYSFSGWSGDLSGATNPETITVDEDKAVIASFAPICFTLSTDSDPVAGGSVTPSAGTCPGDSSKYLEGSVVSLSASPATGYSFTSWSGDASGSANPGSVTMSANKSVTANFTALACYDLTLSATNGSITPDVAPNCGSDQYYAGTEVELSASPAAHYSFSGWSGDLSGSTNPETITVDEDKAVTASFAPICFDLELRSSDPLTGDSVPSVLPNCPNDNDLYIEDTSVMVIAVPATGYAFSGWQGDVSASVNPLDLTIDTDLTVTATFTAVSCYELTLDATNGSIDVDTAPNCLGDNTKYQAGTVVELTATPDQHYDFSNWSGDLTSNTNPDSITMDADKSVTANFTEFACYDLTLTADSATGGTITVDTLSNCGDSGYYDGTVVELTANPAAHYVFTGWSGDLSGTGNPRNVTMDSNQAVTASFDPICFTLSTDSAPLVGGSINPSVAANCPDGSNSYLEGTSVSLTAAPATGYSFSGWSGDLSGSANPRSITMDQDWDVTATFALIPCYDLTLTADPVSGGSISVDTAPNCGTDQYYEGTEVELTADAATGWYFTAWSADLTGTSNPMSITMDDDKSVIASFEDIVVCYDLTITVDPAGDVIADVAPNCNGTQYAAGTVVTLTANSESGYTFSAWIGDLTSTVNPFEVTVNADTTLTATFEKTGYIMYIPMALK